MNKVRVISFANQKGGVGKSTLCLQTAFYLAEMLKKKVLVLDMDPQGNTSSRLAPKAEDGSSLFGDSTRAVELYEAGKPVKPLKCLCGADLIHTIKNDPELSDKEAAQLTEVLIPRDNLASIRNQYDYILIDCPPSLGRNLVAALVMSTHVVCPVQLSGFAVDGVEGLLKTIISVRDTFNPDLQIAGLLINSMYRSVSHDKALAELQNTLGDMVFKNKVMQRPPLDTATGFGVPIWTLTYGHVAAKEVATVLDELIERVS